MYHSELEMVDASLASETFPEVWVQQCTHSGTEGATGRSQTDSSLSHPRGKDATQHFKKLRCPRWGRNYTNTSHLFKLYQMISCLLPGSIKLVAQSVCSFWSIFKLFPFFLIHPAFYPPFWCTLMLSLFQLIWGPTDSFLNSSFSFLPTASAGAGWGLEYARTETWLMCN